MRQNLDVPFQLDSQSVVVLCRYGWISILLHIDS